MTLLAKGQSEGLLEKSAQPEGPKKFYVGAGWDGNVDLDLVAVPIRDNGVDTNDVVYFQRLNAFDNGIVHAGDALDGDAPGDDESLVIDTSKIPPEIKGIVIGVIAYNVDDMSQAKNTKFTIRDGESESANELYTLQMSDDDVEGETVLVACSIKRTDNGFAVTNVGTFYTEFTKGMPSLEGLVAKAPSHL